MTKPLMQPNFKAILFAQATKFVEDSGDKALLFNYRSDGTPILAQKMAQASLPFKQHLSHRAATAVPRRT